jgi:hypothetical protein
MADHTGIAVPAEETIPEPYPAAPGQGLEPEDAGDDAERDDDEEPGRQQAPAPAGAAQGVVAPRIVAFVSRKEAGLVAPRNVSRNVDTNPGGVAVHYGGGQARIRSHADCVALWRAWQKMHMSKPRGWSDIAYTGGYCNHGYALAGRGLGVRTAGQGTNDGNQRYFAFVWLNGTANPTSLALGALGWWIQQARAFGSGSEVRPHRSFHSTSCPGNALAAYTTILHKQKIDGGTVVVGTKKAVVQSTQRSVHVPADGYWAKGTDAAVYAVRKLRSGHPDQPAIRAAQRSCGVSADGVWGPNSKAAHKRTVRALQVSWKFLVPKLGADGLWGPATEAAFTTVRGQLNGKKV